MTLFPYTTLFRSVKEPWLLVIFRSSTVDKSILFGYFLWNCRVQAIYLCFDDSNATMAHKTARLVENGICGMATDEVLFSSQVY